MIPTRFIILHHRYKALPTVRLIGVAIENRVCVQIYKDERYSSANNSIKLYQLPRWLLLEWRKSNGCMETLHLRESLVGKLGELSEV